MFCTGSLLERFRMVSAILPVSSYADLQSSCSVPIALCLERSTILVVHVLSRSVDMIVATFLARRHQGLVYINQGKLRFSRHGSASAL